jgi:superfamily II DNA helicase RecQ
MKAVKEAAKYERSLRSPRMKGVLHMQISITAIDGIVKTLSLEVSGFKTEVSGFDAGRKLVITENDGGVSITAQDISSQEIKPEASPRKQEAAGAKEEAPMSGDVRAGQAPSGGLFRKLSDLRRSIAEEARLPAYTIFQDKSLHAMCEALPQDIQALRAIKGVGEARITKYGDMFVDAIKRHLNAA